MATLSLNIRLGFPGFSLAVAHRFPTSGITALFGASGSGKSSLLRTIAGLERTATGEVRFGDELWQGVSASEFVEPHRRGVGYVFQGPRLFPHLDVAGNLRFADRRSGDSAVNINYADVVDALDLGPLLGRRPLALSGGEAQRVSMGRALLSRPRLLLMDEPLTGLDTERRNEILPFVETVATQFDVPIVYVSHSMEEVARIADDMLVLSAGRVVAHGPVTEVLERIDLGPATGRFEAGVVLHATVTGHDDVFHLTHLELSGQKLSIPKVALEPGRRLRLRIRARDVSLALRAPEGISIRNVLAGTVQEILEEPETAYAEVAVETGGSVLRARLTRASVHDLNLQVGAPVHALIKSIAFDRRSVAAMKGESRPG